MVLRRTLHLASTTSQHANKTDCTVWKTTEGPVPTHTGVEHRCARAIPLPREAASIVSVEAELIRCSYQLVCTIAPVNGCCRTQLQACIPVLVVCSQVNAPPFELPAPPPGWDPLTLKHQVPTFLAKDLASSRQQIRLLPPCECSVT
jgi:hypothetical protein